MPRVRLSVRAFHDGWKEIGEEFDVDESMITAFKDAGTDFTVIPLPEPKVVDWPKKKAEAKTAPKVESEQISSLSEGSENG